MKPSANLAWAEFCKLANDHVACSALASHSRLREVPEDTIVIEQAGRSDAMYLVSSGHMRAIKYSANGHKIWLADIGPGDLAGEMAALIGGQRSSFVEAADDVLAFAISGRVFLELAVKHGEIGLALSRMLARRTLDTSNQLMEQAALSVEGRLYAELLRVGKRDATDKEIVTLNPQPTVIWLAERIHTSRETASRAMSTLERRGLVDRSVSPMRVIDPVARGI